MDHGPADTEHPRRFTQRQVRYGLEAVGGDGIRLPAKPLSLRSRSRQPSANPLDDAAPFELGLMPSTA
jgi:hypothetical protein